MNQVANTVMIPREEYDALVQQRDALQHQLSGMTDSAKHFSKGMEYYRDLIDEAAKSIGIAMYTADDQGVHPDPLRAKLPECVAELVQQRDELLAALKEVTPWLEGAVKCKEFRWDFDQQQCAEGAISLANAAIAKVRP